MAVNPNTASLADSQPDAVRARWMEGLFQRARGSITDEEYREALNYSWTGPSGEAWLDRYRAPIDLPVVE